MVGLGVSSTAFIVWIALSSTLSWIFLILLLVFFVQISKHSLCSCFLILFEFFKTMSQSLAFKGVFLDAFECLLLVMSIFLDNLLHNIKHCVEFIKYYFYLFDKSNELTGLKKSSVSNYLCIKK